ncbi:MAG: c-type cytochrome [Gammaproteobacteria bacterium]|nr:c-type cytochrome [Gammaproteobacteria bacterium]
MKSQVFSLSAGIFLLHVFTNVYSNELNHLESIIDVCESCHGNKRISTNPAYPILAGQNKTYLVKQINMFRKGVRKHPFIKEALTDDTVESITKLADYFSNLKSDIEFLDVENSADAFTVLSAPENFEHELINVESVEKFIEKGESLYASCSGCHGLVGEGIEPYPKLSGQLPEYIRQQLTSFKNGVRMNTVMKMMTVNLNDKEIAALSLYIGSLSHKKGQTLTYVDTK